LTTIVYVPVGMLRTTLPDDVFSTIVSPGPTVP
jgi:hypothetical protein